MRIHALINYDVADLGSVMTWANNNKHQITTTAVYENANFPDVSQFDLLVILGGVMSAYDEENYPWLKKEKDFIKKAIDADKGVLGICLGAQMIAEALGGKAYPQGHLELGWWDVQFSEKINDIPAFKGLPTELKLFQYHEDTFQLPPGATHLAKSKGCENQAFIYGDRVIGLQFHPEFSEEKLEEIADLFGDEMESGPFSQVPDEFLGVKGNVLEATDFLYTLLDNLENIVINNAHETVNIQNQ
jgi:GMP synthase-like glutamine amidotransferase